MSKLNSIRTTSSTLINIQKGSRTQSRWESTHKVRSGTVAKRKKTRTEPCRRMYTHTAYNQAMHGGQYIPSSVDSRSRFAGLPRTWEDIDRPRLLTGEVSFSVMTYNVLSQYLLESHMELYQNCHTFHLGFEFRGAKIVAEILHHRPTIVCLQEVDEAYFRMYYCYHLAEAGYVGTFYKKTGFDKYDGLAIFYNRHFVRMVGCEKVQYFEPGHPVLDRHNIGLISVFEPRGSHITSKFCVATTHLLFNKSRGDVKLAQLAVLLARLYQCSSHAEGILPIIICGDFNSVPLSPLYNFMIDGKICYDRISISSISGQLPIHAQSSKSVFGSILPTWMDHDCLVKPVKPPKSRSSTRSTTTLETTFSIEQMSISRPQSNTQRSHGGASQQQPNRDHKNTSNEDDALYEQAFAELQNPASLDEQTNRKADEPWGKLSHPFKFFSCYEDENGADGYEAGVTSLHNQNRGIAVDHLFYSVGVNMRRPDLISLRQTAKFRMPTSEQMFQFGALPNHIVPSDHVPLIANFCLK